MPMAGCCRTLTVAEEWILTGSVTQLVLAILAKDTRTTLERWVFDIKLVEPPADSKEAYARQHAAYLLVNGVFPELARPKRRSNQKYGQF
jgi:hypothetical protein